MGGTESTSKILPIFYVRLEPYELRKTNKTLTIARGQRMDRSKIIAVLTGAIAIILSLAYLLLVQLLDFRGEMLPAPVSAIPTSTQVAQAHEPMTIALN
jgi:hypothetical protein